MGFMKHRIVADGQDRLQRNPEFKARLRQLRVSILERHASELAKAGLFRRSILRWQIWMEYRRERQKIVPSSELLYVSRFSAGD